MSLGVEVRGLDNTQFIKDVKGKRPSVKGKIKIPNFNELPLVRGIFKNLERAGTGIEIPLRLWKGPVKIFSFFDGVEYIIPRVVADHLNDNCYEKVMQWRSNGEVTNAAPISGGKGFYSSMQDATKEIKAKRHRFLFQVLSDA